MTTPDPGSAPAWLPAMTLLDSLGRATETAAVIRSALRSGLLERLRRPASPDDLARGTGADPARVAAVLHVLETVGITARDDDLWCLSPPWAALLAGESPTDVPAFLEGPRIRAAQFESSVTGGDDYWELAPAERLTIARSVSFEPASPFMATMLRRDLAHLDGVVEALESGGRVLELGCGVGSRLTALALTFPALRAVGVELDESLVIYGRRRAAELGVADRITYVVGDATAYESDLRFDLVNWSQFFFPTRTRAGALRTAWTSLRPGGWVTTPVIWADEPAVDDASRQELALEALNLDLWGVPARSVNDVRAELESAGFVDIRADDMTFINLVRGRRPGDTTPTRTTTG